LRNGGKVRGKLRKRSRRSFGAKNEKNKQKMTTHLGGKDPELVGTIALPHGGMRKRTGARQGKRGKRPGMN